MITVKGALAVNKIAFLRGPSRFNVANKRVSPRKIPIIADKMRIDAE